MPGLAPTLKITRLSKSFGGERALDGVELTVNPGEVHGLLGANGSGKSTLIKILAGYHDPEPGAELEIMGEPVRLPLAPGQFRRHGMSFVHQDLGLIPSLSTTENLRAGQIIAGNRWWISWHRERNRVRAISDQFNLDLDPMQAVGELQPDDQALLAIIRAFDEIGVNSATADRGLLVLDEPTVFLGADTTRQLFRILREIASRGFSVLFVSHDLDEIKRVTDRVTVLRDGRVHGTVVTGEVSESQIVEMIVGRRLSSLLPMNDDHIPDGVDGEPAIAVDGLRGRGVDGVSLAVRRGEILGVAGVLGSKFNEVPYLLIGGRRATAGRLRVADRSFDLASMTPARAATIGLHLLPADRHRDGSVGSLPTLDNVMLPVVDRYFRVWLRRGAIRRDCQRLLTEFAVKPPVPERIFSSLSGGNQQKALLARALETQPALLLLDEPTMGVDVGAREKVLATVRDVAASGTSVICASSDHGQLATLCDRVLIFRRGAVVHEVAKHDLTKDRITERCYGSTDAEAGAKLNASVT